MINQIDLIIVSFHILVMTYLLGLGAVFIMKSLVMQEIDRKYDAWRKNIDKGLLDFLPEYFCEWCFIFWVNVIIILIFCSIFGFWYLIITPLFSTPVALNKYK